MIHNDQKVPHPGENHLRLHRAIQNLHEVISHAERLDSRISGDFPAPIPLSVEGGTPHVSEPLPSLLHILGSGSGEIDEIADQLHQILNSIEDKLF